jgi:hypothetical protein
MDSTEEFKEPIPDCYEGIRRIRSNHWPTVDPAFNSDGRMEAHSVLSNLALSQRYCVLLQEAEVTRHLAGDLKDGTKVDLLRKAAFTLRNC